MRYILLVIFLFYGILTYAQPNYGSNNYVLSSLQACTDNGLHPNLGGTVVSGCYVVTDSYGRQVYAKDSTIIQDSMSIRMFVRMGTTHDVVYADTVDLRPIMGGGGGGGTVNTDGTLTGDGSLGSPLSVNESSLTITQSQISDLSHPISDAVYGISWDGDLTNAPSKNAVYDKIESLAGHNPVTLSGTPDYITLSGQDIVRGQIDLTTDVTGLLPGANINSITESQISDLGAYLTTEVNNLTSAVTWANVPDANITQSSVTQHQAALTITESQISDLDHSAGNDSMGIVRPQGYLLIGQGNNLPDTSIALFYDVSGHRLGIGTNTPSAGAKLHLHEDVVPAGAVTARFTNSTTGTTLFDGLYFGYGTDEAFFLNYENTPLSFWTNGAERLTILGGGNVGIGTASPAVALDVVGEINSTTTVKYGHVLNSSHATPRMAINATTGTNLGLEYQLAGSTIWLMGAYDAKAGGNIEYTLYNNQTGAVGSALTINGDNNNVGIGTTSPNGKLDVNGSVRIDAGGEGTNYFEITDATQVGTFNKVVGTSFGILDFSVTPSDGTSAAVVRFNRNSATSGGSYMEVHSGAGAFVGTRLAGDTGTQTWLAALGGNVSIGTQASVGTSANKVLGISNGTAPTTAPADMIQLWSADVTAGQANLFARNEAGSSQQLTGLAVEVTSNFSVTSSTALVNITGLSRNVEAGKKYKFDAILYTTSANTGGIKASVSGTATATSLIYEGRVVNSAGAGQVKTRATTLGTTIGGITNVTVATMYISGRITVNAAGTLTIQFAQNVSDGTASIVLAGSNLVLTPLNN